MDPVIEDKLNEDVGDPNAPQLDAAKPLDDQPKIEEEKLEEDVTKLDVTQPEHLTKFKSAYQARVSEVSTLTQEKEALSQELDQVRANQGVGVYLDTNVPLEDFNPQEPLARMETEEPEYFERVKAAVLEKNFWPTVSEKFEAMKEMPLDPTTDPEGVILKQSMVAWDVMCQRMVGVDGNITFGILKHIADSPDIKDELMRRVRGESAYNPEQPFQPNNVTQGNGYQQPQQVETVQAIATRLNLDPSEEVHLQIIRDEQAKQRDRLAARPPAQPSQPQQPTQQDQTIAQLQKQIEDLKNQKQKEITLSDAELEQQATSRFTSFAEKALQDLIQTEYSNSVGKDKQHLLSDLKDLTQIKLDSDTTYQQAKRTAIKWFKQANGAKNKTDMERWDQKGQDALAVMVPIRLKYLEAKARELLGPIKRKIEDRSRRAAEIRRPKELTQEGRPVSPRQEASPAASGDIASAKENILRRVRDRNLFQPR